MSLRLSSAPRPVPIATLRNSMAWKGSHHALAMQKATVATVLGDFADAKLEHFEVSTTFFRDGDKFMVGPTVRTMRCTIIRSAIPLVSILCSNT
jgi:hypothetical protein